MWTHSQIVGYKAFSELNDKLPALYVGVKCSGEALEKEYSLIYRDIHIALEKDYSSSGVIVLVADIRSIDRLLEKQIRDSTEYKKVLDRRLEETKLIVRKEREEIPKSKSYIVKYGYEERRIE
ncbi:MAG: hypothetical protein JNK77_01405 [Saprospiraceae bacterium]|nr:hypothetical protein [Saprospiraceae bacterium]